MAQRVRNLTELKRILNNKVSIALQITQDEVYKAIQQYISEYYKEPVFDGRNVPDVYHRTYQFLNSLIKTELTLSGNCVSCSVKIDMGALHYVQPPEMVIDMINRGFHADISLNDENYKTPRSILSAVNFWDDAIGSLGGTQGIVNLIKKNLIKCGIPIIN